jgi:hypothetical protein
MFNHCFPLRRVFLVLLCWVTTFYLYAPLREHSCHSECNVHCPKVIIDWFIILVSLVLKLFVSSRPLKLEGVLCIYVLLLHEGQAENHLLCFFHMFETHMWLSLFYCSWPFIYVLFHVITWLLSFLLSRLCLLCPYFKFFWSQHSMLT